MGKRDRQIFTIVAASALAAVIILAIARPAGAQNNQINNGIGTSSDSNANSEMNRPLEMEHENPDSMRNPPMGGIEIREPLTGTMIVSPPYGNAPLRVGFIIVANDPENIGFLTYQWNFGDGTVSSLPPVKFIPHTYKNPGNYMCSLTLKTVDGRSKTIFTGVVVRRRFD